VSERYLVETPFRCVGLSNVWSMHGEHADIYL